MSPADARSRALSLPLLGAGRAQAAQALADLVDADQLDPPLALRRAALLRSAGSPRASAALSAAARLARRADDARSVVQAELWLVRWRLEDAAKTPPGVPDLPPALAEDAELQADHALALALFDPARARTCWDLALARLPQPARDHDRLGLLERYAATERDGGDRARARQHLRAALALTRSHDARVEGARISLHLGLLLLESGERAQAAEQLQAALDHGAPGSWERVAAASTLFPLRLEAGPPMAAARTAGLLMEAARARHNFIALADGAMGLSTCRYLQGDLPGAIDELLGTAEACRAAGVEAAVNLIKGRLAELRHEAGPEVFDAALAEAVGRRQG